MFLSRHMSQCQCNHAKTKIYWNNHNQRLALKPQAKPTTNKPALTQKSWLLHSGVSSCFIQQVITSAQVKRISDASCLTHCGEAPLVMPLLLVGHHKICICVNKQARDRHVSLKNLLSLICDSIYICLYYIYIVFCVCLLFLYLLTSFL